MRSESGQSLQVHNQSALLGVISGIGIIIGSLGPWVKATLPFVGTITVNGTDGNNDGTITLVAGAGAAILMGVIALRPLAPAQARKLAVVAGIFFFGIAGIAIYDWNSIQDNIETIDEDFQHLITAGWGLYLTGISGIAGLIASFVTFNQLKFNSDDGRVLD
jgi:hypothetical protein